MFSLPRVTLLVLAVWLTCYTLAEAQSRLINDTYTFSGTNFDGNIGVTTDPIDHDVTHDHGTPPVTLTIDGVEEVAGGMRVNERIIEWPGVPGGIPVVQEAGIDGETEFDLIDWELDGLEVIEFSFKTVDGEWVSDDLFDQSFMTMRGLDWANSKPNSEPFFFQDGGFYIYFTVDGQPLTDPYVTVLEGIGLLVGAHPYDETIPEVAYIGYSPSEVDDATDTYPGGVDFIMGTTDLDPDTGSWAALLEVLSLSEIDPVHGKPANGFHLGILVEPPAAGDVLLGDYNNDGQLNAPDLDLQAIEITEGDNPPGYDLNNDSKVDYADRQMWVEELKDTWIGDANLDGEFNSSDMVQVFAKGKYEMDQNANWEEGDWNGNLKFDSGDMVAAFVAGGYEKGARAAAVSAVPEPHGLALLSLGAGLLLAIRRRQR